MDLKSFIRRRLSLVPFSPSKRALDPTHLPEPSSFRPNKRPGSTAMRLTKILALCSVSFPILFVLSLLIRHPPSDPLHSHATVLENLPLPNSTRTHQGNDLEGVGSLMKVEEEEKLLGGLLAAGFDDSACLSRYHSFLYKKNSIYNLSSYLVSRLRRYEDLHRKCGPGTEMYNVALEQIRSGKRSVSSGSGECKYVVWISFSGLGNRILSLASTFLYTLLVDRVLLVDRGKDMADLFCEPFPGNSWLLPMDFPLADKFGEFDQNSDRCYGNMLKNNVIKVSEAAESSIPSYLYLHLVHDYGDHDKLFFCEGDQSFLAKVPWLIVKTDNYFVPSLFLIDSFDHELSKLFPKKGTVFHHLGRYLFHPSNAVWGLIARYYHTHMAKADDRIGLQIRVFDSRPGPFKHVMDQIVACTTKEKLLPDVQMDDSDIVPSQNPKMKSVLVTSLNSGYSEILSNMYWENPTKTGEVVAVFQPSHEEYQQTEKGGHNRKALAEMYLLSMTDVLVTSSWSTFGYVAQGLGGLKPWILYKPENDTTPDPPCRRAMSMEPCFHAPPFYDCKEKRGTDTGALVPHVRHCEDMSWGLKVVDGPDEL